MEKIAKSVADFTIRHYGSSSTVVFDGYEEESRISHDIHTVGSFTDETDLSCKREGLLSRETDPNERYVINCEKENVTWLTNMSGDAYVNIVNMTVETSLQHMTTLTVSPCLLIYFAQAEEGKSIYLRSERSDRMMLSRSLQKEYLFFDLVSTHSQSRTRQHRFSNESSNGCPH